MEVLQKPPDSLSCWFVLPLRPHSYPVLGLIWALLFPRPDFPLASRLDDQSLEAVEGSSRPEKRDSPLDSKRSLIHRRLPIVVNARKVIVFHRYEEPHRLQIMRVSVLIPALNEQRTLSRLLPSVIRAAELTPTISEILLLTSPSMDRTEEICSTAARRWGCVKHVAFTSWIPKLHALVRGATEARNEWLLLLDADIQVQPETLGALAAQAGPKPAIVQARNVPDCLDKAQAQGAGDLPTLLIWAVMTSLAWHWVRTHRADLRWAVSGQCYLCHRNIIPAHSRALVSDDVTIGLNCLKYGYPIQYSSENVVVFRPAQRWGDFLRQKLRNRIGLARLREEVPDKIEALRYAFRSCLRSGTCFEGSLPKRYWRSAKTLLFVDAVLWSSAKKLAGFGLGSSGKWRAVKSTKE